MRMKTKIVLGCSVGLVSLALLLVCLFLYLGSSVGQYYDKMDVYQYKLDPMLRQVLNDADSRKGTGCLDKKYQSEFLLFENPESLVLVYKGESMQDGRLSIIYHKETEEFERVIICDADW